MAWLVRAETRFDGEHVAWLGPPRLGGHRTFAPQELAERFDSLASAKSAIEAMCDIENCRGIQFTIESED